MSIGYYAGSIDISNAAFDSIMQFSNPIIEFFRANPNLLESPYKLRRSTGNWCEYVEAAHKNPIIAGLHALSINIDQISPGRLVSKWNGIEFSGQPSIITDRAIWTAMNVRSYCVIDLSVYLVMIANIFTPNSGLIKNLYDVNVETDALGRTNERHVEAAIKKVVRRYDINPFDEDQVAAHVVLFMKRASKTESTEKDQRGVAFERRCSALLEENGFEVRTTPMSGDFGADLTATKYDLGFVIQCKDTTKPVGVKAIQEAVAARSHYKMDYAVVCSVANFTNAAIELATSNNVILSSSNNLIKRLDAI